jgi:hypothetical protein
MRNFGSLTGWGMPFGLAAAFVQRELPALQVLAGIIAAAYVGTLIFLLVFLVFVSVRGDKKHAARAERILKMLIGQRLPGAPPSS